MPESTDYVYCNDHLTIPYCDVRLVTFSMPPDVSQHKATAYFNSGFNMDMPMAIGRELRAGLIKYHNLVKK